MWLNNKELLVIECSFSLGRSVNTIKVFVANFSGADNISAIQSLDNRTEIKFVTKRTIA